MKYVYMLRAGEYHYKIGVATNIEKRLKSIQTSQHSKVSIVTSRLFDDASLVERTLHKQLAERKGNGGREWFELTEKEALNVCVQIHDMKQPDLLDIIKRAEKYTDTAQLIERFERKLNTAVGYISAEKRERKSPTPKKDFDTQVKEAWEIILKTNRASTSSLQVAMGIGYGKAARIIARLENIGAVGPADGTRPRAINHSAM